MKARASGSGTQQSLLAGSNEMVRSMCPGRRIPSSVQPPRSRVQASPLATFHLGVSCTRMSADVDKDGQGTLDDGRLYQLVRTAAGDRLDGRPAPSGRVLV
jgi:hypothetical protein